MTESKLPYLNAYGNLTKTLNKIKQAATPPRFTQDFLATKLDMKGGSPKPVIPFLKRVGFLASDGTPTDLYREFRNDATSGRSAAAALRHGFAPLFELNEYAHDAEDDALKGLVVQATGSAKSSPMVKSVLGSFKALREFAEFDGEVPLPNGAFEGPGSEEVESTPRLAGLPAGVQVGYTINLHLPPVADVAVFNAIFKALRENLLR